MNIKIKRLQHDLVVLLLSFLLLILIFPYCSWAGEYHSYRNGTLICDECHTIQERGDSGFREVLRPVTHQETQSLVMQSNKVCTSCHDNNPAFSDVVEINMGRSPQITRQAGALNTTSGRYPYREGNGHTLGITAPAPGSRPMWIADGGLMCIDCHDPHGDNPNGNSFRNLTALPGNTIVPGIAVTYSLGTNDPSQDVYVRSISNYDISNVDFNEPIPNYSAIADFCQGCHNDFHGAKGGTEVGSAMGTGWIRHPSSEADIGWVSGRHSSKQIFAQGWTGKNNFVKVMTNTAVWTPRSAEEVSDHSPTCVSCHKAHGNMNPFGLIFMANTGPVTEEGTPDGKYLDLCRQCHVQSVSQKYLSRQ